MKTCARCNDTLDDLEYYCKGCALAYCEDHRTPTSHECSGSTDADPPYDAREPRPMSLTPFGVSPIWFWGGFVLLVIALFRDTHPAPIGVVVGILVGYLVVYTVLVGMVVITVRAVRGSDED